MAMERTRPVSIHAHDDGVNRWRMVRACPTPRLATHVSGYSAYSETTGSFSARQELAGTMVVLIVNLGEPIGLTGADGHAIRLDAGEAFVAGFADGTSISRSGGSQRGVHVFMPWQTLVRLCGCPAAELMNRTVRLDDLLGAEALALGGRMAEAGDEEACFVLLDAFIARRLAESEAGDARIAAAVARLKARPDTPIAQLARGVDWCDRHFLQRFRDATGLTPARFARLARFERFTGLLAADPAARLADLAQDAGFYDEPHMAREVRTFAGLSPGALRARLIPGGGGFVDS